MADSEAVAAQVVHWQSAFWGIAVIAFTTATQDAGEVLGLPAK
jgi:hypothetical protein